MKRNALILGALSLVFAATTAQAQDKPSFAGSWTLVVDPNAPAPGRGGGGGLGQAATITQDTKALTITSLVDRIWFSYTACPDVAPHIDRLGPLITGSYDELERVMARPQRRVTARRAKARSRAARG